MRRLLLSILAVGLVALTGCGTSERPAGPAGPESLPAPGAAAAPTAATEPGAIPALTGDPTDLTAQSEAVAGGDTPPTELLTEDIVVGTGPAATPADTVDVRYSGTLYSDGTPFDSSWSRGDAPISFPLSGVVPGFAQGIEGMQPGGRRVMVIPPELGYGSTPNGPIPADSTLVFVVDLVSLG